MKFNKNDLKFDESCYFEDYLENASGIAEDLANFAGGQLYPTNKETLDKLKEIMKLPIHRGYLEEENGRHYVDAYKYKEEIYNEQKLTDIVNSEYGHVEFGVVVEKEVPVCNNFYDEQNTSYEVERDVEPFNVGISDLFYYKAGPDGKGIEYFEPYDSEESIDDVGQER